MSIDREIIDNLANQGEKAFEAAIHQKAIKLDQELSQEHDATNTELQIFETANDIYDVLAYGHLYRHKGRIGGALVKLLFGKEAPVKPEADTRFQPNKLLHRYTTKVASPLIGTDTAVLDGEEVTLGWQVHILSGEKRAFDHPLDDSGVKVVHRGCLYVQRVGVGQGTRDEQPCYEIDLDDPAGCVAKPYPKNSRRMELALKLDLSKEEEKELAELDAEALKHSGLMAMAHPKQYLEGEELVAYTEYEETRIRLIEEATAELKSPKYMHFHDVVTLLPGEHKAPADLWAQKAIPGYTLAAQKASDENSKRQEALQAIKQVRLENEYLEMLGLLQLIRKELTT